MIVRKCRLCGFPKGISSFLRWSDEGTITERVSRDFRAVLIEADFLPEVFKRIEAELGISIQHLVFEAQRIAAAQVIQSNTRGVKGVLRWPGLRQAFVRVLSLVAILTGQGYARILYYHPGRGGEALFRNPFQRELMAAIVVGSIETLDGTYYDYSWRKETDGEIITLKPADAHPDYAARLTFNTPPAKPGRRTMERCPRCHVPSALKGLEWDTGAGQVFDGARSTRMVILDLYTPNVVLRELVRELGEEVVPLIIDAGREFFLDHLRKEFLPAGEVGPGAQRDKLYGSALETLALGGLGNPVTFSHNGEGVKVVVENPYNPYLLAGFLSALFELAEGRRGAVEWEEPEASSVRFILG